MKVPKLQSYSKRQTLKVETPFPADSIIAAAVNQKYKYSVVVADGFSENRTVVVEKIRNEYGHVIHRVKVTELKYFQNRDDAMDYARTRKIKITEYGDKKNRR